jgi:hypothetical protein
LRPTEARGLFATGELEAAGIHAEPTGCARLEMRSLFNKQSLVHDEN